MRSRAQLAPRARHVHLADNQTPKPEPILRETVPLIKQNATRFLAPICAATQRRLRQLADKAQHEEWRARQEKYQDANTIL